MTDVSDGKSLATKSTDWEGLRRCWMHSAVDSPTTPELICWVSWVFRRNGFPQFPDIPVRAYPITTIVSRSDIVGTVAIFGMRFLLRLPEVRRMGLGWGSKGESKPSPGKISRAYAIR